MGLKKTEMALKKAKIGLTKAEMALNIAEMALKLAEMALNKLKKTEVALKIEVTLKKESRMEGIQVRSERRALTWKGTRN